MTLLGHQGPLTWTPIGTNRPFCSSAWTASVCESSLDNQNKWCQVSYKDNQQGWIISIMVSCFSLCYMKHKLLWKGSLVLLPVVILCKFNLLCAVQKCPVVYMDTLLGFLMVSLFFFFRKYTIFLKLYSIFSFMCLLKVCAFCLFTAAPRPF